MYASSTLLRLCHKPLRMAVRGRLQCYADPKTRIVSFSTTWTEHFGLEPTQRQHLRTVVANLVKIGLIKPLGKNDTLGRATYRVLGESVDFVHSVSPQASKPSPDAKETDQSPEAAQTFLQQLEGLHPTFAREYPGIDRQTELLNCRTRYHDRDIVMRSPLLAVKQRLTKASAKSSRSTHSSGGKTVDDAFFRQFGGQEVVRYLSGLSTDLQQAVKVRLLTKKEKTGLQGVNLARIQHIVAYLEGETRVLA